MPAWEASELWPTGVELNDPISESSKEEKSDAYSRRTGKPRKPMNYYLTYITRTSGMNLASGKSKGKCCTDATCPEIIDCLRQLTIERMELWKIGEIKYQGSGIYYDNCRTYAKSLMNKCCLELEFFGTPVDDKFNFAAEAAKDPMPTPHVGPGDFVDWMP